MLRHGSGGERRSDDVGAVAAVAAGAPAEFVADAAVAAGAPAELVADDQGAGVGPAATHSSGPLSLPRLSAVALAGLGRDELLGLLGDIERVANRLAGYRAEVLGALDVPNQSGAAPDASPHLSLRDAAGVSERDARRMVRAAEKAREHGAVLDALSGGDINTAQAETLCDARVPDPVRAELVAAAADEDTDATRQRVRRAEAEHSVETSMERFERQRKARGAGWRRDHEGMLRLWGKFDPDTGAHVEAALEALRREYWIDDKQVRNGRRTPAQRDADVLAYALAGLTCTDADAAAVRRLHDRARGDGRPSDTSQSRRRGRGNLADDPPPSRRTTPRKSSPKRAAAGRDGADHAGADATRSGHAGADTTRSGHAGADATRSGHACADATRRDRDDHRCCDLGLDRDGTNRPQPGRHESDPVGLDGAPDDGADRSDSGDPWDLPRRLPPAQVSVLIGLDALRGQTDEMGLTDAGVELPPEVVRRLACDAEIIPMILDSPGGSADAGRCRRTVPLRLRRLLVARDRHCRWPGCHEPPSRCDAHHVWHWIEGGPTDLDNLVLLCHRHHHFLHKHGYKMVPQSDGAWTTVKEAEPKPTPRRGKPQARAP